MFDDTGYIYAEHPTMRNTPREVYNCAGYALNLFKWYVPTDNWEDYREIEQLLDDENYNTATLIAVNYMCENLGYTLVSGWKVFNHGVDYKKYEIVAFRYEMCGECSDFHYMKIGRNGSWYEKRGHAPKIHQHEYDYAFETWAHRYDGPIAFLIKEREL